MNLTQYITDIIDNTIKRVEYTTKILNEYDQATIFYRNCRYQKMDPILYDTVIHSFEYPYRWDPYTGENLDLDPDGSLHFNPVNLLNYFYQNRLNNLWITQSFDHGGFSEGYYGELVGIGFDFIIVPKGNCPEKYLFRLPIKNCYLKKNYDRSVVTSSPKLSNKDIIKIDDILNKYYYYDETYQEIYHKIKSLHYMKTIYDLAISKTPSKLDYSVLWDFEDLSDIHNQKIIPDKDYYLNRLAVEILKQM